MNESRDSEAASPPEFAATRWTLVTRARGESAEARAALSDLCERYYNPVLTFLRREGRTDDAARELTQDFFARVLARAAFDGAEEGRGRFRSYLLGALKHFLSDVRQAAQRQKRGGGITPESLDAAGDDSEDGIPSLQISDSKTLQPDHSFDREWALEIMKRGLLVLEAEMKAKSREEQFQILKPALAGDHLAASYADAALRLGLSEGAVKVAVHRLRKRFSEIVRQEITQTLRDPAQADEELAHLVAALSS